MGSAKKTGTGKESSSRQHHCPQCDKPAKPVMYMPGRRLEFVCENAHSNPKSKTVLK